MTDKPKRKYTSTPEGREAKRRSLEKVRASVPKEVLFRGTPKRKEASRNNLKPAREAKRRKHEQGRSICIHHGLTCADLRGSLAMAGVTPQELEAHRQKFLARFAPRTDKETNLALGMADCIWRCEQALHVHAVELVIGLKARMIVAAEPSQAKLGEVVVARLALDIFNRSSLDLNERLVKLNGRLEHLAWLFLVGRGEEEGFGGKLRWNRHNVDMINWSAAAMGNPFLALSQVAKALAPKSGEIKPASEFEWKGKAAREAERLERIRQQALDPSPRPLENFPWEHPAVPLGEGETQRTFFVMGGTAQVAAGIEASEWPEWREKEVAAALRQEYLRTSLALRGEDLVGGVSQTDLVQVFRKAFGRNDECRIMNDERRREFRPSVEAGTQNAQQDQAVEGNSSFRIHNSSFSSDPADVKRIKAAAGAAGELVKVFEDRAHQAKEGLAAILAQAGQSARQCLDQIMSVFKPVTEIFLAAGERLANLQQKLCALLKSRPGAWDADSASPRQGQGFEGRSLGLVDLVPGPVWIDPKLKEQFLNDLRALAEPPPDPAPPETRKRLRWRWQGLRALGSIVLEGEKEESGDRSQESA
ncbi:MAG TPA: hypothetical protein VKM93_26970 [Terriglobia bacterium]|nr:hypothetical protein [Terriglobia bacterium]